MMLITKAMKFPAWGSTDTVPPFEIPIVCKWFTPDSSWTWYVTEYDGNDTCFGLVDGHERELGYFSLSEIEKIKGPMGLPVERDLHYGQHMLSEVL